jgi:hypothetical protein
MNKRQFNQTFIAAIWADFKQIQLPDSAVIKKSFESLLQKIGDA